MEIKTIQDALLLFEKVESSIYSRMKMAIYTSGQRTIGEVKYNCDMEMAMDNRTIIGYVGSGGNIEEAIVNAASGIVSRIAEIKNIE